jgi:hypothetical protein
MTEQQHKGAGMDPRFAKMYSDPRFQRFPKKKAKVEIDSRFAGKLDLLCCGLYSLLALLLLLLLLLLCCFLHSATAGSPAGHGCLVAHTMCWS